MTNFLCRRLSRNFSSLRGKIPGEVSMNFLARLIGVRNDAICNSSGEYRRRPVALSRLNMFHSRRGP